MSISRRLASFTKLSVALAVGAFALTFLIAAVFGPSHVVIRSGVCLAFAFAAAFVCLMLSWVLYRIGRGLSSR